MSAEVLTNRNGITLINPNKTNVNQEDLMVYVRLIARTKSRSIVKQGDNTEIKIEQVLKNVRNPTNYTYQAGSKYLTTDWTDIGGHSILNGQDKGGFGITSIDIDIKSSFQPVVVINFVDIRGATLFEQGPCSPYSAFFHMPYPVFELTVKGFYGRPVTYTLALRKFNAKFNASTGNFEIQGEFIGYTYAFLADLLMGYALAAPYMPGADNKLTQIWQKILNSRLGDNIPSINQLPQNPITLKQMIKDVGELEKTLGELANTEEFQLISKLNLLKTETNKLTDDLNRFIKEVDDLGSGVEKVESGIKSYGNIRLQFTKKDGKGEETVKKVSELVKNHFGSNDKKILGSYEALLGVINNIPARSNGGIPELAGIHKTIVQKGLYVKDKTPETKNNEQYYYIDLGYFKKQISEFNIEVDKVLKTKNEEAVKFVNEAVQAELKYVPTIRNVSTILLANMELFLQLLVDASWKADEQHESQPLEPKSNGLLGDGEPGSNVVNPWPTYYQKGKTDKGGDVETYPGENPNFLEWEEVKFVEDYLKAYLTLKEELNIIAGEVEGKPGFDNFIPLTPLESPIMDTIGGAKPIAYWRDKQEPEIYKNIGERAFLLGDYTLLNGLTAWKARYQLGVNSTPGNSTTPQLSTVFNSNRQDTYSTSWWDRVTDYNLMEQYGKIDGMNAVNSITETVMLTSIRNQIQTSKDGFKQKVIDQLNSGGYFKSQKFSEWASSDPTGVSSSNIITQLKKIDDTVFGNLTNDTEIYTYSSDILIGEPNFETTVPISPNPHNNISLLILEDEPSRKITLKDNLIEASNSKSSPFNYDNSNGFKRSMNKTVKDMLTIEDNTSFFKLDEKYWIPTGREELKDNFLRFDPWADDSGVNDTINYSIGGIDVVDTNNTGINFGMPWSPNSIDDGIISSTEVYDALIQTPLWIKNYPTSKNYRRAHNWYISDDNKGGTYYETSQTGLHSNPNTSYKALAYLALITMGWSDESDEGFGGWYDKQNTASEPYPSVLPFFRITGGQTKVPKGFALLTGAVLWRLRESGYLTEGDTTGNIGILPKDSGGSVSDPIKWWTTSNTTTTSTIKGGTAPTGSGLVNSVTSYNTPSLKGFKKLEPYHWPYVISSSGYETKSFALIENNITEKWSGNRTSPAGNSSYEYVDIRDKMHSLLMLPNDIKIKFIEKFEQWALGTWKTKYIKSFDPLNFGSSDNIFDSYSISTEKTDVGVVTEIKRLGIKNGLGKDGKNNDVMEEMYTEMYNSYYTLVYTTPKAFSAIHRNDFRNEFNIRKVELDKFVDGWMDGFISSVDAKLEAKADGEDANQLTGENALNDPDIKLSLYKSFKSLFDKWISRSNKSDTKYELFYNNISTIGDKERLLIDHFNFVDRGLTPIGDKAVVNITPLKSMADNPTASLYMVMSELLKNNDFDFFPLPSFIPYGKDQKSQDALRDMFEPITDLTSVESSPSFVCMYIGGASQSLSLGKQASAFCSNNNEILYRYEDDSVSDLLTTDVQNLTEGNVTAFLVDFGIENQSHFKAISLNQAEFKETQESLMVIDQLAKGGNENNRVSKGQNLYNVYQTRSYTCEVETLGNTQIQPMMYFQLNHVPMFHGSYIITEVKHNVKPHYITTTFKGTRVPKVSVPLVTDAYSTMVLGQTDTSKTAGSATDLINSIRTSNGSNVSTTWGSSTGGETIDISGLGKPTDTSNVKGNNSDQQCPNHPRISDGGVADAYIKGDKYKIRLCKVKPVAGSTYAEVNVSMALNLAHMYDKAEADGVPLAVSSSFRTMEKQTSIAQGYGCYKNGTFVSKKNGGCRVDTAKPGRSNHQSGTALDVGCGGPSSLCYPYNTQWCSKNGASQDAETYPCFKWMVENAQDFGYYNLPKEAWHWSATGG